MRHLVIAAALFTLSACSSQAPTAPDEPSTRDLTAAPTSVMLGGSTLTLDTSLWRDFMPISPPDGKPLVGVLRVRTVNGSMVPDTVRADAVWVIFGEQVWSPAAREERSRTETSPVYELVVRDGPKWGPNVTVDVVVRLREASGPGLLLRAANQPIRGTF